MSKFRIKSKSRVNWSYDKFVMMIRSSYLNFKFELLENFPCNNADELKCKKIEVYDKIIKNEKINKKKLKICIFIQKINKKIIKYKFIVNNYNNINLNLYIRVHLYYYHNILLYNNHLLHVHLISILYFYIN
jgi:hypothetical protein